VDAKLIFRFAVGHQRSPFFLNVNPENFRIASISFFPGRGIRVRAARALYGARYTVGDENCTFSRDYTSITVLAFPATPAGSCPLSSSQGILLVHITTDRILLHSFPVTSLVFEAFETRSRNQTWRRDEDRDLFEAAHASARSSSIPIYNRKWRVTFSPRERSAWL